MAHMHSCRCGVRRHIPGRFAWWPIGVRPFLCGWPYQRPHWSYGVWTDADIEQGKQEAARLRALFREEG